MFPYPVPRQGQTELLSELEKHWNRFDVFIVNAPTAFGKASIMKAIMNWKYNVSAIVPTNQLIEQFLGEFPDTRTLKRMDSYRCEDWNRPCSVTRAKERGFCRGCTCAADLSQAKYRKGPGIYNYHILDAHSLHREVIVVDEAHNLSRVIEDNLSTHIWQHDYKYPDSMNTVEDIRKWLAKLDKKKLEHKKIKQLIEIVESEAPKFVVRRDTRMFNGKGTARGIPEERDCLVFYPVNIADAPPFFWPQETKKIIMLSATISHVDIRELGLDSRKVVYLNAASPIPPERRPVQLVPIADLNYDNIDLELPNIAREIQNIADYHHDTKGFVHVTYSLAEKLRPYLTSNRFIFHDKEDKQEQYQHFRDAEYPAIMIACGMYEGVDLVDDLARWQIVAKVPWKSLGDPAIQYKAEKDEEWYIWSTLRDLIQACGRVCRKETDYGCTYILDASASRLIKQGQRLGLVPRWFQDALDAGEIS